MAYIRSYDTKQKRKGKTIKRYEVCWREPATDANGLPTGKQRGRQESYPTREAAEARRDELNAAKHNIGGTAALADQRKAGSRAFGYYAAGWLDEQAVKLKTGKLKVSTYEKYQAVLARYALKQFGEKAVAAITPRECERFRADLVERLGRKTVRDAWQPFRSVLRYAQRHNAIPANPADAIDFGSMHAVGDDAELPRRALTGPQVAALAVKVGELYPVYELLLLFLAYSGLRAAEAQGLEIRDLITTKTTAGQTRCTARVERTKTRRHGEWVTGTPKSKHSKRTVPLPPWLTERMAGYLAEHPHADDPTAPLWPRRRRGGYRHKGQRAMSALDWSQPCDMNGLHTRVIRPALAEAALPHCRVHDLRHTFAALQLSAGVHYMQVSKWMGHATYVITLTTYGEWIPEDDGGVPNALPEPVAKPTTNVVPLRPAKNG